MLTKKIVLTAFIALISSASMAQTAAKAQPSDAPQRPALTRAEVREEVRRALANGELQSASSETQLQNFGLYQKPAVTRTATRATETPRAKDSIEAGH